MSKEKKENISDEKKERKLNYMSRRNEIMDEINHEEKMKVRFTNNEFPSAPADFVFEGIRYHLEPGKEYTLPYSVINHINSLMVPDPRYETDPVTGQLKIKENVQRARWSAHPVALVSKRPKGPQQKAVNA